MSGKVAARALSTPDDLPRVTVATTGFPLDRFERTLALYLRSAWQLRVPLQARARHGHEDEDWLPDCPIVTTSAIMLPGETQATEAQRARRFYLACAAHAAAHLSYSTARFEPAKLRPLQLTLVGALEDARVERLAIARYPGLQRWWLPFHRTGPESAGTAVALIARLARGLLDPGYVDRDGWVTKGRTLFDEAFRSSGGTDPAISRHLGVLLGNDLGQMRIQFNAKTYVPPAAYRDDNSLLWDVAPTPVAPEAGNEAPERNLAPQEKQDPGNNGSADETSPPRRPAETAEATSASSAASAEEVPTRVLAIDRYAEWDYVIRRYRPAWSSVESLGPATAPQERPAPDDHAGSARRIRALFDAARVHAVCGRTREFEGDQLDLDACIAGRVDARRGRPDSIKGFIAPRWQPRGVPLAVLLDLSASNAFDGRIGTVLDVGRQLGRALRTSDLPYAIYGFHSDGRHRVRFHVFKDFDDIWSGSAEAYLASIRPGLSTRFGAALRHAGARAHREAARLGQRKANLLIVSDCVPFDIDVFDPRYLREDMRRAITELVAQGLACGCLALDAQALGDARALFGRRRVVPLTAIDDLAAALAAVLAAIG